MTPVDHGYGVGDRVRFRGDDNLEVGEIAARTATEEGDGGVAYVVRFAGSHSRILRSEEILPAESSRWSDAEPVVGDGATAFQRGRYEQTMTYGSNGEALLSEVERRWWETMQGELRIGREYDDSRDSELAEIVLSLGRYLDRLPGDVAAQPLSIVQKAERIVAGLVQTFYPDDTEEGS